MRNLKIIYIIEKKPFTLDKDKEDQNKCYLTFLDMKWENHDINVVEWVMIPIFPLLLNGD